MPCSAVLLLCCIFFFNDTATTEIYTTDTLFPYTTLFRSVGIATHYMNSDTLDGIKGDIIADPASIESILNNAQVTPPPAKIEAQRADIDRLFASDRYEDILAALKRSEEHTYELQSLMRISYAVLRLKKNIK